MDQRTFTDWHSGDPVHTTNSWQDYREGMKVADISVVFNIHVPDPERFVGTPGDPTQINEATAEFVASDPTRIGFISIDPTRYDWAEEMDKSIEMGLGHLWARDAMVIIRKHPNVYADASAIYTRPWIVYEVLLIASEWKVMHKLLFGSDFPIMTPQYAMDRLRDVNDIVAGTQLPKISLEHIEQIIHADVLGMLNLQDPRRKA
jgi:hypothetical protein